MTDLKNYKQRSKDFVMQARRNGGGGGGGGRGARGLQPPRFFLNSIFDELKKILGNKEKQRYIDKSICLLATRFTYYPVRIIKPFYYI